jgi:hypothetical protein
MFYSILSIALHLSLPLKHFNFLLIMLLRFPQRSKLTAANFNTAFPSSFQKSNRLTRYPLFAYQGFCNRLTQTGEL